MNLNPRCPKLPFKQASKKADLENASPIIINKARNEKKTGGKPDSPPKDDSKYNHRAVLGKPHSIEITSSNMMKGVSFLVTVAILALASSFVSAYDPSPLQDFCVAINDIKSGEPKLHEILKCKRPKCPEKSASQAQDSAAVAHSRSLDSTLTSSSQTHDESSSSFLPPKQKRIKYTLVNVDNLEVSTLWHIFGSHRLRTICREFSSHSPSRTELLVVIEGTLLAGFVTSDPNKLFTKVLNKGDVFIFPIGLIHFQINIGETAALAFANYAPYAVNSPHTHPRGTELLVVIEGTLLAGFVTSDPNKLFTKVLNKGDVFIFPIGLIHFQINIGETAALAFASFNSQNPGLITVANAVFGSNPPINPDVLIKAFQLDNGVVEYLQKAFVPN
ncbi:germin-like protein subfamily 1 member 17 [Quercus suber]|uniref:Germin-like protein subfamily 1 member 17 n=1 Tax=Quercus suber TaxID=58331 RepID=A0AAW0JRM7_QUESU